ncbi:Adenosylhomocysteinase [Streptomyces misionensis JCM 4497]
MQLRSNSGPKLSRPTDSRGARREATSAQIHARRHWCRRPAARARRRRGRGREQRTGRHLPAGAGVEAGAADRHRGRRGPAGHQQALHRHRRRPVLHGHARERHEVGERGAQ